MPRVDGGSSQWRVDGQEFPALETQKTASKIIGSADPGDTGRGRPRDGHPSPIPQKGTAMFRHGVSEVP